MRNQRHFDRFSRSNPEQEYQANTWIRSPTVRLIDENGTTIGVTNTREAMARAQNLGLDLVTVSDSANPPVCRICDLSKYIYEQKKLKKEQDKKNRENTVITKEVQIRPSINEHDLLIKQRHAKEFLDENHKIKVTMSFRGREMMFANKGLELVRKFIDGLGELRVEKEPTLTGNTILTVLAPAPKPVKN